MAELQRWATPFQLQHACRLYPAMLYGARCRCSNMGKLLAIPYAAQGAYLVLCTQNQIRPVVISRNALS